MKSKPRDYYLIYRSRHYHPNKIDKEGGMTAQEWREDIAKKRSAMIRRGIKMVLRSLSLR